MSGANEVFAMKRVPMDSADPDATASYMNEMSLLRRLAGNRRIIRLIDSELKPSTNNRQATLTLIMECGEIGACPNLRLLRRHADTPMCSSKDLARLLQEQQQEPMDLVWVSYYWKQVGLLPNEIPRSEIIVILQMLQAVHVIHEEKIVHSDLKPANFVLVKGQLKLIDFGIANAIANDTTNIQRDHQVRSYTRRTRFALTNL